LSATVSPVVDDAVEEASEPRRGKRLLAVVALVALLAAAAAFLVLRGGDEDTPEEVAEGHIVEVAQMTANLAGGDHYVRFGFAVVLHDGVVPGDVDGRFPLLQDAALSTAQGFGPAELVAPDGTDAFRHKLSERAVALYPDGEVVRVVLTELLVQ
jgi:flagellar protein FliL